MRRLTGIGFFVAHLVLTSAGASAQDVDLESVRSPGCREISRIGQDPALREYLIRWVDERLASREFLILAGRYSSISYPSGPHMDRVVNLDMNLLGLRYDRTQIHLNRTRESLIKLNEDPNLDTLTDASTILSVEILYARATLIIRRNEDSLGPLWGEDAMATLQSDDGVVYFSCG